MDGRWTLAGMLGASLAGATLLAALARGRFMRVAVAGESMTPELAPGEFLVLRGGVPRHVRAGDIAAVRDPRPDGGGRVLLKRVVGLPGEALRVGGGVQVNGRALEEPYAHGETPLEQHRGINRLADDEYFLLGDHRGASTDSRDFGPVRRDAILGVAWARYWPPARVGRLRRPPRRLLGADAPPLTHTHEQHVRRPLPWLGRRQSGAPGPRDAGPGGGGTSALPDA